MAGAPQTDHSATGRTDLHDLDSYIDDALALHRELPVFVGYFNFSSETYQESGGRQSDLEKLHAAGVRCLVASIGYGCYFQTGPREYQLAGPDEWLLEKQLGRIEMVVETVRQCPRTRLITRAEELAFEEGGDDIGVLVHLTGNNHTVELPTVDTFFERGVRAIHPAMQYHNRFCTGTDGLPGPALTEFGRQVVGRMDELGMVVDTAHASDESALAMIEASAKPVIDGHTTSRDLVPSSRGLRDEVLKRIADTGGVVGIHFADHMLSEGIWDSKYATTGEQGAPGGWGPRLWLYNRHVLGSVADPEERMRLRKNRDAQDEFFRKNSLPPDPEMPADRPVGVGHLADLVDYLANLMGGEHVAIGGDVNGIDDHQWPEGMDHIGHLPRLTAELLRRGYGADVLQKILSGNWTRVYRECLPD